MCFGEQADDLYMPKNYTGQTNKFTHTAINVQHIDIK